MNTFLHLCIRRSKAVFNGWSLGKCDYSGLDLNQDKAGSRRQYT